MDKYTFIVAVITAIATALPPTIVAIIGLIKVFQKVSEVHQAVNGRIDQLLIASNAAAIAIGRRQVTDEQADAATITTPPIIGGRPTA